MKISDASGGHHEAGSLSASSGSLSPVVIAQHASRVTDPVAQSNCYGRITLISETEQNDAPREWVGWLW